MSIEGRPWRYEYPRLVVNWEDDSMSLYQPGDLLSQGGDWARRRAYYDKHKPAPLKDDGSESIDSWGDRWTFSMRDDGEAECRFSNGAIFHTAEIIGDSDWSRAALAYRDKERARWTFEACTIRSAGRLSKRAETYLDGKYWGYHLGVRWRSTNRDTPTWVREKARKLWEESQKPKRVEFKTTVPEGEYVSVGSTGFEAGARVRVTIEEVE
jgi:hypothetical protein